MAREPAPRNAVTRKPHGQTPRRRLVFAAAGAAVGAAGLVTLFGLALVALVHRHARDGGDYGLSGYFFLVSVLPVGAMGAVIGGLAAWRLSEPGQRPWGRPIAALLLFFFAVAAGVMVYEVVIAPRWDESRYLASQKQAWLKGLQSGGLQEEHAVDLARRIVLCTRTRGPLIRARDLRGSADCGLLLHEHIATPAPRSPTWPEGDRGWRWRFVGDHASWHIRIEPVAAAALEGPIFEVTADLRLLRRQTAAAEAAEIPLSSQ